MSGLIKKLKQESAILNSSTYFNTYNELSLLARNMFEWDGLDELGVDTEFLEKVLYEDGLIVFFKDEDYGFMVARGNTASMLNIYEKPTSIMTAVVGSLYQNKKLKLDECVVIRNTANETPTRIFIKNYAHRIADTQRTIDVNISQQKTPLVVIGDDKQQLSLQNMYMNYDGNTPVIFANKSMRDNLDSLKVLKTDAPYLADKLLKYKHDIKSECYTFLGVNNVNTDKKERLITDEANANNEQIELSAEIMLQPRKRACKLINEMFGINCSVKLREVDISSNLLDNESEDGVLDE